MHELLFVGLPIIFQSFWSLMSLHEWTAFTPEDEFPTLSLERTPASIRERLHDSSNHFKLRPRSIRLRLKAVILNLLTAVLRENTVNARVFRVSSNWLLLWNVLVMISIIYNLLEIPVAIFFTSAVYTSEFDSWETILLVALMLLILLTNMLVVRPNTAKTLHGNLIFERLELLQLYLSLEFICDLVSWAVLFFYAVSNTYQLIYLKVLFYLSVYTLTYTDQLIQLKLKQHQIVKAVYMLLRMIVLLMIVVMWLSGIFFAIDYHYYKQGSSHPYYPDHLWLTNSLCTCQLYSSSGCFLPTDIIKEWGWWVWLNYAVYWALQTISTLGYGDITPRNPISTAYTNVAILSVVFFFVYFLNSVREILSEVKSDETKQTQKAIKEYLAFHRKNESRLAHMNYARRVSRQIELEDLKEQVCIFLQKYEAREEADRIQSLLRESLPQQMNQELFFQGKQVFFRNLNFFTCLARTCPNLHLLYEALAPTITQQVYSIGEIIYERGAFDQSMFYLQMGNVVLSYPQSHYSQSLQSQSHPNFGVKEFLLCTSRETTASANSYTRVLKLSYGDLFEALKKFPYFYEAFRYLQLELQLKKQILKEECWQCRSVQHALGECPQLQPRLQPQLQLPQLSRNQSRKPHSRDNPTTRKIIHRSSSSPKITPANVPQVVWTWKYYDPNANL